jgi:hypothetical protein
MPLLRDGHKKGPRKARGPLVLTPIWHPRCCVRVVLKARGALEAVFGRVHHQPPLLIFHGGVHGLERYRNILLTCAKEAATLLAPDSD